MSRASDKTLNVVMILLAIVAVIFLAVKAGEFYAEIQSLRDKVETNEQDIKSNTDEIQKQKEPCTKEDIIDPKKAPGCNGEDKSSSNPSTSFGGAGSSGTMANPQRTAPAPQQPKPTPPAPTPKPTEPTPPEPSCLDLLLLRVCE